jgi:serine/threonine-protein kinase PRP4
MASPDTPSHSEGEILEREPLDKATTARSDMLKMRIDRRDRQKFASRTDDRSRSNSDSPQHGHHRSSRSRSRSPYRHTAEPPRGEKRPRDDEHSRNRDWNDSRRVKHHYNDDRRQRGGYRDYDRPERRPYHDERRSRDGNRREERDRRAHSRSRSRSRSPWSRRRDDTKRVRFDPKDDQKSYGSGRNVDSQARSETHPRSGESRTNNGRPGKSNGEALGLSNGTEEMDQEVTVRDEAAEIEERRKKREALKAKFKNQPTPLLVHVLNKPATESNPSTPLMGSTPIMSRSGMSTQCIKMRQNLTFAASPSVDSPMSQGSVDTGTEFAVENDAELANTIQPGGQQEGPSAADYDPTVDMQEDRAKHDHRLHDMSASGYDETHELHDTVTAHLSETEVDPKGDDSDMFASDDDDDMFAAEDSKRKEKAPTKAKQLDAHLKDDWDDHDGYYKIIIGELLDSRYHVLATLGKGMFAAVVRAEDQKTGKLVAIKIIRNNESMKKAGAKEIDMLQRLADADPDDKKHLIRLERSFEHKNHLCMVFENLSINLREVLKKFGRDVGINLKAVRTYAHQMFLGLKLLKTCGIIHADLKPDNMLVNDARNLLKICDLGSAGLASDSQITPYLASRFYRAPEIILGMEFDYGIDMWAIGCTLYELYTGKILFTGRNNNQMLRSMMECRGKFSLKMLKKGQFSGGHFDQNLLFKSVEFDKITGKEVLRMLNLAKPTRDLKVRLLGAARDLGEVDTRELNLFVDLLDRCLTLNPDKRISPADALNHPFINRHKSLVK